ncbi:glycine betaine/proline transport system substrate-binding protein [Virgibacillus natechei]|uniref:Glycine betaine/proline transport system substrate-binding protein n=1 Tax=Virgibacillus natechei TaxID=1216297 RepID=A0ABS4IIH1_9BACI|nr:ABC transporter substrate-binding protein [Virgibacillus natechei]MBP1970146.1 glycine betaine/proline transport system substrate-binding protein [Virgibacillus natechei]UZD14217.1 ABC transporter substrate-binding protein [Virgibacillus natechei]
MKKKLIVLFSIFILVVLSACGDDTESENDTGTESDIDTIVLSDAGWDSNRVHNSIAQMIIEEGYDQDTDVTAGTTAATFQGLVDGDINVYMEAWTDNIKEIYEEAIEAGDIEEISVNFDDNDQGLYVPTYVIEGDPERDIEPMAPDLRTVEDLKDYPEVFEDPEDPERGRVINAPSGWAVQEAIDAKFEVYGLDETLNNFMPGSDAAIVASLTDAYESGEAWVGYYWSPTGVTAQYDLTLLEEPAFDEEIWEETKATEFPPNDVTVAVHKDLPEQAPDVVEFLSNYETNSDLTEQALTYMDENDADPEEAAIWWMEEHEDIWTSWVSDEIAEKVKEAL